MWRTLTIQRGFAACEGFCKFTLHFTKLLCLVTLTKKFSTPIIFWMSLIKLQSPNHWPQKGGCREHVRNHCLLLFANILSSFPVMFFQKSVTYVDNVMWKINSYVIPWKYNFIPILVIITGFSLLSCELWRLTGDFRHNIIRGQEEYCDN